MTDYGEAKRSLEQQRGERRVADALICRELEPDAVIACNWQDCGLPAAYTVEIHNTDRCDEDDLTPDGNIVYFLCRGCLARTVKIAENGLAHFHQMAPNVIRQCVTCGRPIACLHDVLDVREL